MLLDKIEKANDIKKIDKSDYGELAEEIRQFLIEKISVTGGHLGSNLGAVELTMALHLALNLPEDKIIWDVGHQSYTHKILTGRKDGFDVLSILLSPSNRLFTALSRLALRSTGNASGSPIPIHLSRIVRAFHQW